MRKSDRAGTSPGSTLFASTQAANTLGLFSAHQMGSCRMGYDAQSSAIDCDGESWEVDDLFVVRPNYPPLERSALPLKRSARQMDASTFPTASGANPMLTTLAIAQLLSARLVRRLAGADPELEAARAARRAGAARGSLRQPGWCGVPGAVWIGGLLAVVACWWGA
eukprot:SAG11_NODE_3900_length_2158_cov_2.273919_2_plen_166_part_00